MMGYWGYGGHMPWIGMGMGMLFNIAFLILLFYLFSRLFRRNSPSIQGQKETALDILKKRYAKGEITSEEFHQMKKDIE